MEKCKDRSRATQVMETDNSDDISRAKQLLEIDNSKHRSREIQLEEKIVKSYTKGH